MVFNGNFCYGFDGEIYMLVFGGKLQKVFVKILFDRNDKDLICQIKISGVIEMVVFLDGKEVVFILRGDVYVILVEYKIIKQVMNIFCQEWGIDFVFDGCILVYVLECGGFW